LETEKQKAKQMEFSAAFSGGPIEVRLSVYDSTLASDYFPLLLAAAPLKSEVPASYDTPAESIFRCF